MNRKHVTIKIVPCSRGSELQKYDIVVFDKKINDLYANKHFCEYILKNGSHFNEKLASFASEMMINSNGKSHTWTSEQISKAIHSNITNGITIGDLTYLANMYYSDFYPDVLKDEDSCIKAAEKMANDVDGYDGMVFYRWLSDVMCNDINVSWENYI